MQWQLSPGVIVEAATALVILIVAVYFPWRDISRRARLIGSALLVIAALWILTHSLEIGTPVVSYKAYLMGLQLIWGLLAMTLWLMYIIHYVTPEQSQTGRIYVLFGIMPLLAILAVATNPIHGWLWTSPGLNMHNAYLPLEPAYGVIYWIFMAYLSGLIAWGVFLILKNVVGQHNFRRWEPWTLILAVAIPLLVAFLEMTGFTLSADFNIGLTPFFSGIASGVLVWSLPRFHLQKIIPVARNTVFEQIGDCVVVLNMQNRVVDLNPAAEHLAGYTSSEALGLPVEQIWNNWPRRSAISEPASAIFEELTLAHAGEQRTYDLRTYTIVDRNNRPLNKVVLLIDTTERKQMEEELKVREEQLKGAQAMGRIGSWEFDVEKRAITWSEETYVLYERDPKLGPPSPEQEAELYSLEQAKVLRGYTARAIENGQTFSSDLEVKLPSGKKACYHAVVKAVKSPEDRVVKLVGTVQDITELKLAEETLRASEKYSSSLIEISPYPIQILNLDTGVRHVNPAFEKLTGYTESEISGIKPPFPWWVQEYISQNQKLLKQGMQSGLEHAELHCRKKNGELFWVEVKSVAKPEEKNAPGYYLSLWTDITEHKMAEEELARLIEELRIFNLQLESKVEERTKQLETAVVEADSANKAKSEFLASMSHELRTPLNAVIGFAQVLQQQYYGPLNEKQAKYIGNMLESGKHLLSLINDILDLSKIEAGKEELVLTNIKIKELMESSLVMVKEKAADHRIKLELQIPSDVDCLEIKADERKVKQILFNLLSNAVKFTPDGGYVTVKCIRGEKELIIRVSDSGIGLAPEQQNKLFERFYQISGGIKNKTPGTGLGLSLAKGMTEMHGGRMWVESEGLGKGSCFAFTLPLQSGLTKENL